MRLGLALARAAVHTSTVLAMAAASCAIAQAQVPAPGPAQDQIPDLPATYRFLVSEGAAQGGILYRTGSGSLAGLDLPLSFTDSAEYWGAYVCAQAGNSCAVTDLYNPSDYTLRPPAGTPGTLQIERVNVHNGTNIYDAATWQIAVVLGQVVNHFVSAPNGRAFALADHVNRLLRDGFGAQAPVRAVTRGSGFRYGGRAVDDAPRAYAFRMLASPWVSADPLRGSRFGALIRASPLPVDRPEYQPGTITWSDWKPITGENAWALLLGPLQAAYLHYLSGEGLGYVPFADIAVQNALGVLPTFALMQSPLGAVYSAPALGPGGGGGGEALPAGTVSVENNLSLYAGLKVLQGTLRAELAHDPDLQAGDRRVIRAALRTIRAMIDGGTPVPGTRTPGLLSFFKSSAWRAGEFVQGGVVAGTAAKAVWRAAAAPKAVDVNTWGIAALGAGQIDGWFGLGAAFNIWQNVKRWGGYGVGRTLWGVGYSDRDGNGLTAGGDYQAGVLSAEWTAGAITAVRALTRYYAALAPRSAFSTRVQGYLAVLHQDEAAMLAAIQRLRMDRYPEVGFAGTPPGYGQLLALTATRPYLYASRRYWIPFGWYANPIPSTCATSWVIMVADRFDPFGYGGMPN